MNRVITNSMDTEDRFNDNAQKNYQPNKMTIDALNEFNEMKKNKQDYKRYSSFKEILKEI